MIPRFTLILLGMLLATDASAVDYVLLSPSEFAQDLQKASLLLEQHDYAAAAELLEVLVADEPKDADALSLLGFALRKGGNPNRAQLVYRRALTIDPAHLGALQYLGELYVEQGQLDLAREQLRLLDGAYEAKCEGRKNLSYAIASSAERPHV